MCNLSSENQEILNNMKFRITSPKQTQLIVAKDIVCMVASSSSIGSNRGVAKVLGVGKKNIRKVLEQRV
jgi:hypothetical protein